MAITRPTRQPLLDGARALLKLGYDPAAVVTARHAGSEIVAMRRPRRAGQWTIKERDGAG